MPEPAAGGSLKATFDKLRSSGRRAFIPYITAGDPATDATVAVMQALAAAGADIIELGIPFSDPLADGPVIQAASWRALERGVDIDDVLAWTSEFSQQNDVPVVLFSYVNPILRYEPRRFVRAAVQAGARGLLVTDLPLDGDVELESQLGSGGLELVRLVAPTTTAPRVERILAAAQGFIYYISRTGVTGVSAQVREALTQEVAALKAKTALPVAVGFGISRPEQARLVASVADGVVVGSCLVQTLAEEGLEAAGRLARSLRDAIDSADD